MEELWKARVTLQGAVFFAIVALWILFYADWKSVDALLQDSNGINSMTIAKAALGVLGGGALLLTSGQIIAAITTVCLKVFWRPWGYFDTHFMTADAIRSHRVLSKFFANVAINNNQPILNANSDFDRRLALLYWGQLAVLDQSAPNRASEIQGWVRRRWHAANAYLGAAFAAGLAMATGWTLTCQFSLALGVVCLIVIIFSLSLGLLYRREVIRMVKFLIDKPQSMPS